MAAPSEKTAEGDKEKWKLWTDDYGPVRLFGHVSLHSYSTPP